MPETLCSYMSSQRQLEKDIPPVLIKIFTWQLLRAMAHSHSKGIIHRDIKPQNILVDFDKTTIKICDWGSAKIIDSQGTKSVAYICSRYYRAPELISGSTQYNEKIDIWSIGCVVAEMFLLHPIFQGKTSKS